MGYAVKLQSREIQFKWKFTAMSYGGFRNVPHVFEPTLPYRYIVQAGYPLGAYGIDYYVSNSNTSNYGEFVKCYGQQSNGYGVALYKFNDGLETVPGIRGYTYFSTYIVEFEKPIQNFNLIQYIPVQDIGQYTLHKGTIAMYYHGSGNSNSPVREYNNGIIPVDSTDPELKYFKCYGNSGCINLYNALVFAEIKKTALYFSSGTDIASRYTSVTELTF